MCPSGIFPVKLFINAKRLTIKYSNGKIFDLDKLEKLEELILYRTEYPKSMNASIKVLDMNHVCVNKNMCEKIKEDLSKMKRLKSLILVNCEFYPSDILSYAKNIEKFEFASEHTLFVTEMKNLKYLKLGRNVEEAWLRQSIENDCFPNLEVLILENKYLTYVVEKMISENLDEECPEEIDISFVREFFPKLLVWQYHNICRKKEFANSFSC